MDTNWIKEIDGQNFLAILDVLLDIEEELNIASDHPTIRIVPQVVRFRQLFPGDTIGMRDRYGELRWKATGFLKKKGVIQDFEMIRGSHRWDSRLGITANEATISQVLDLIRKEYKARTVGDKPIPTATQDEPIERVRLIINRLHSIALQIRDRYEHRPTLDIKDEHDVQDLLRALLSLFFDDVRREEWTPSYLGKSSKVDFFLKPEEIVIEVKKTRTGLAERELGDQLIIDVDRYRKMAGCKRLVCFIYDPEERISNPGGFEADLARVEKDFTVEVIIAPKRY